MLRAMLEEMGPTSPRQFPSVRRVVAAHAVGAGVRDEPGDICQWLFPCADNQLEVGVGFAYCNIV